MKIPWNLPVSVGPVWTTTITTTNYECLLYVPTMCIQQGTRQVGESMEYVEALECGGLFTVVH